LLHQVRCHHVLLCSRFPSVSHSYSCLPFIPLTLPFSIFHGFHYLVFLLMPFPPLISLSLPFLLPSLSSFHISCHASHLLPFFLLQSLSFCQVLLPSPLICLLFFSLPPFLPHFLPFFLPPFLPSSLPSFIPILPPFLLPFLHVFLSSLHSHPSSFYFSGDGSCFYWDINRSLSNGRSFSYELIGPDCDPVYKLCNHGNTVYTVCRDAFIRKYSLEL